MNLACLESERRFSPAEYCFSYTLLGMNNLFVYCEIEERQIAEVSLELLTKGRKLADELSCKLEAVVIGHELDEISSQVLPYGVDVSGLQSGIYLLELQAGEQKQVLKFRKR